MAAKETKFGTKVA